MYTWCQCVQRVTTCHIIPHTHTHIDTRQTWQPLQSKCLPACTYYHVYVQMMCSTGEPASVGLGALNTNITVLQEGGLLKHGHKQPWTFALWLSGVCLLKLQLCVFSKRLHNAIVMFIRSYKLFSLWAEIFAKYFVGHFVINKGNMVACSAVSMFRHTHSRVLLQEILGIH